MGSFSIAHWLVVVVVLLLIFGPKRLSEVGKGLGQGIRNFKKGLDGSEKPEEEEAAEGEPKRLTSASKKSRSADADEDADEDEEPKQLKPTKKTANQKRAEREADAD
jgi:sec-independent protein translocase protein TatA